jgi:AcrR family transcriptional regulator
MSPRSQAQAPVAEKPVARLQTARRELGSGRVDEIQRRRMLAAMVDEAARRGAGNVTVAHVVARSGVSRRTFYEIFEDREDCFLATFDDAIEAAARRVVPAFREGRKWSEKVRSGLIQLLGLFDEDPRLARLLIVEALGAGPRALARRRDVVERLSCVVGEGVGASDVGTGLSSLAAEGVVGSVLSVIHGRLTTREPGSLIELVNPLMSMIVLPYEGRKAAEVELAKKAAAPSVTGTGRAADPLRNLEMRLTYRTVMVLSAVAANPGGSNRVMATAAGIIDQGQISKLLARLHGLGLVENTGGNSARGEPNAWILTAKGWGVHDAISAESPSL